MPGTMLTNMFISDHTCNKNSVAARSKRFDGEFPGFPGLSDFDTS